MTIKELKRNDIFYFANKLYLKTGDVYAGDNLRTYNAICLSNHEWYGYIQSFNGTEEVVLQKKD